MEFLPLPLPLYCGWKHIIPPVEEGVKNSCGFK
jgi:hypothetical protein